MGSAQTEKISEARTNIKIIPGKRLGNDGKKR